MCRLAYTGFQYDGISRGYATLAVAIIISSARESSIVNRNTLAIFEVAEVQLQTIDKQKLHFALKNLGNYVTGRWITGDGEGQALYNAVNGETIGYASTRGLDFNAILEYGRKTGNPALRKLTFHERGLMLKALALHLRNHLDKFYSISYKTGATKADSWS